MPQVPKILPDRPIERPEDDALGYLPFAEGLAAGLAERSSAQGFVVGIQAKWGMGKTSAVNLMMHSIKNAEKGFSDIDKTKIERFNPWQFASAEHLAKSYLSTLGRIIADSIGEDVFNKRKGLFKKIVSGGKDVIGFATAAGAVAASGGAALAYMGAIQGGVTGALNLSGELTGADELDDLAANVRKHLENLPHRIVLVLDDIDRLSLSEISTILTLVKTFGDLPNVVHLLIYDREIVDNLLEERRAGSHSPTFLQKIVQAEFDLPPPTNAGLLKLTNELIGPLFSGIRQSEILTEVWRVAFRNFLRSPRDIVKLYNALSITWPAVSEEAYAPDMIAIEVIRLFDRALYHEILSNRSLLVGDEFDFDGKNREQFTERVKEGRSDGLTRLLAGMFPRLEKSFGSFGPSRPKSISEGRPIGSVGGFDAYFRMTIGSSSVSVSAVEELAKNIADADYIESSFRDVAQKGSVDYMSAYFDEFLNIIDESEGLSEGTLLGLARAGGYTLQEPYVTRKSFLFFDNFQRLSLGARKILAALRDKPILPLLNEILVDATTDLDTCVFILAKVGEGHGLIYSDSAKAPEFDLSNAEIDTLVDLLAIRAKAKLTTGELLHSPVLWMHLRLLSKSQHGCNLRDQLNRFAESPQSALQIAYSAMNIQTQGEMGTELSMDRLPPEDIYDLSKLVELVSTHLSHFDYSELETHNLKTFVISGERLLRGEKPQRW